ncbi:hypothetical protein GCM10007103_08560 [Salinimicrobium marinum]|uniref:histidine kinase n=1 Tax=Salinimicrobium marinum TaxID=680283 RepID=A0A918VWE4_9FLAO|nr:histidine kinase [Salinimicrobium marinum]GHA29614.1 hypothetical protein GCM10007103_08560 [Salinimicrobium marinum]
MLAEEELVLIIYFVAVIVMLTGVAIIFFITFQKRKNKFLFEKFEAEKRFENEIIKSRIEIQEQTLKNISWELHDNIGQLLSVANMQLNMLSRSKGNETTEVNEIREIVATSLQEVRSLSKSLNNEVIDYVGLEESVRNEIVRFNRINVVKATFKSAGEAFEVSPKDAIILFRILQETFSNILKHAKAQKLEVGFIYKEDVLQIHVRENGKGFDPEKVQKNSGLINMKSRAKLINTDFNLDSSEGNGSLLTLLYPKKQFDE